MIAVAAVYTILTSSIHVCSLRFIGTGNSVIGMLQGQLVGVCGSIGSGKSSLISAILGQVLVYPP